VLAHIVYACERDARIHACTHAFYFLTVSAVWYYIFLHLSSWDDCWKVALVILIPFWKSHQCYAVLSIC